MRAYQYGEFQCSLVPRAFLPPVSDHLQYANMDGEGQGDLVTCGNVRATQRVDTQGAVPDHHSCPWTMNVTEADLWTLWPVALRLKLERFRDTPLGLSTLCLPDVTARDQISPSVFAYCKQSKTEVGVPWERGYLISSTVSLSHTTSPCTGYYCMLSFVPSSSLKQNTYWALCVQEMYCCMLHNHDVKQTTLMHA